MTAPLAHLIRGAGGGGKGGGKGGGGVEAPNTLRSTQVAKIIDLISEGPIVGLVDGAKSIYFDGVRVMNPDGSLNFADASIVMEIGLPDQPVLPGFAAQQSEHNVGLQLKTSGDLVRTIINADVDRARVTISVPSLMVTNKNNGNVTGLTVQFELFVQANGGGWQSLGIQTITGKTNARYQRAIVFPLAGPPPWDIRLKRITPDSITLETQNDLYWDSYTEIIDARINYNSSAVVAIQISAEQFQAVPKRTYRVDGRLIRIPSNYDPRAHTYSGVWDGTFQIACTNNPAWIFYDLVTDPRYGLGDFITADQVDKWALYSIGQFCDQQVDDGRGGYEPRFVCNLALVDRTEAFDLLASLASIFRGFHYWAGGQLVAVADQPVDPVGQYSQANVINGLFTYAGADIKARHNQATVAWNDPANLGEPRISIVEDQESIAATGIQATDLIAIGATSEGQALRAGKWVLFTELYEDETVSFSVGLGGAWSRPGNVVRIADRTVQGKRRGGRVLADSSLSVVSCDAPIELDAGELAVVSCYVGDEAIETRDVIAIDGARLSVSAPFSAVPIAGTIFVVASGHLEPTLWRVIGAVEGEGSTYDMQALRHRPDKWGYVEQNLILSSPVVSIIGGVQAVTNLGAIDYMIALSPTALAVEMLISWSSLAPAFDVDVRPADGNWTRIRTATTALNVPVMEGPYEIQVTPLNSLGQRGTTVTTSHQVVGKSAPPVDPKNFRIQVVNNIALFQWAPSPDLDVLIGGAFEMRYTPRLSGANWGSSNTILQSIPGTATSVETSYRTGTYLLRTRDITGLYSTGVALVIAGEVDSTVANFFRICEAPTWLGGKANTEIHLPQEWLIIGTTGGFWDDQTLAVDAGGMDAWLDVDVLPFDLGPDAPTAATTGAYIFDQRIDLGGRFSTRLTVDMLAFPYLIGAQFVDDRPGNVDTWQAWDDATQDLTGQVQIRVRQTDDDPGSTSPTWSDWKPFTSGEYTARAFEFQAVLTAPFGQNVAIEELCILADISNKVDQGSDISWAPAASGFMAVAFDLKFYLPPSVSILVQQGELADQWEVSNKTREGFDLRLLNNNAVLAAGTRTFDWISSGY